MLEQRKDKDNPDVEWQDITDFRMQHYNISESRDTTRKGYKLLGEYIDNGWNVIPPTDVVNFPAVKQTTIINADKTETSDSQFYIEDESQLRDDSYLLKLYNYDPHLFELVSAKNSKWNAQSKEGTKVLYSSKITVKPKIPEILEEDLEKWFEKLDRKYSKSSIVPKRVLPTDADKLLILPISDLHFNLLASFLETGNEYNCKIAENLYFDIIADVIERTKIYKFEKIIFCIGGDQVNTDNIAGTTTKGTPQNNNIGYFDMMENLYEMTIKAIEILSDKCKAPIEVLLIQSNHDKTVGYNLAKYCYAWFKNNENITVDYSPRPRKYIKYGKTLFCFSHDADTKRIQNIVPDEAREFWSDINFTEVFLQHLHHEVILKEDNNMRIQRLPTISAKSTWVNENCYNSKRQCKSFIYDKNYGLTDVLYTVIK